MIIRPGYWKLPVLFCILCFSHAIIAQVHTINWATGSAPARNAKDKKVEALSFEGAVHKNAIPYFVSQIRGKSNSVSIVNPVYTELTSQEGALLPDNFSIPENISPELLPLKTKGKDFTRVSFCPVRKNPITGMDEKLVSFSLQTAKSADKFSNAKTTATTTFASTSVLASGDWYQFRVSSTGVRKIDYTLLQNAGVDVDNIDPRNIQLYGNGGGMLSQVIGDPRKDDLQECAIFVSGESDGTFDPGDYILFYAEGPHIWEADTATDEFHHITNIYTNNKYYFLTVGMVPGKRMSDRASLGSGAQTLTTYNDYRYTETDSYSHLQSGREWFGDIFNFTLDRTYVFNYGNIASGSTVKLTSKVMSTSTTNTIFNIELNGVSIGSQTFIPPYANPSTYGLKGNTRTTTFPVAASSIPGSSGLSVKLTYNKQGNSAAKGYLDYLELNTYRNLTMAGSTELHFSNTVSVDQPTATFQIASSPAGMMIWDVTDHNNVQNQLYSLNSGTAEFSFNSDSVLKFVAISGSDFSAPIFVGQTQNQNLHGILTSPELLIVTHPSLRAQADQLANYKQNTIGMTAMVVETYDIYNEFSCGAQDISSIRDFIKMLYDRSSGSDSLKYVLLFGDGSFDYKNRVADNTNYVPIYESRVSLHNIDSYSSDDFYGFMETGEGYWEEDPTGDHTLDIGVGRLPVRNGDEAQIAVNKIIHYSNNLITSGNWRNRITLVADDGDGVLHMDHAETHSSNLQTNVPVYNQNKIYLDAYTQVASPGGEVAPDVNDAIDKAIERGTLVMNYSGHGGGSGWSQESILNVNQLLKWNNLDHLPLFITATCEFGRIDEPDKISAAEHLINKGDGGAIALVTTTRPVFAHSNKEMNIAVFDYLFVPSTDSTPPTLGDVILRAKNKPQALFDINNRNFSLLGDPSLTLAYPKKEVVITEINDSTVSATPDTIKALGQVTVKGEVRWLGGSKISNFSGQVFATVFDKETDVTTLGNEGAIFNFQTRNNVIYEGQASVTNGEFSFSFIVPKDISYQFDYGKISLYAKTSAGEVDAHGLNSNIVIGGTADSVPIDNEPPEVTLFMDDESFVFGGTTAPNTTLLAKLEDDNGINISNAGIGHEITSILDGDDQNIIIMNDFYISELDDYTKGRVEFPFKDLEEGNHSLRVKAWDTHNNSGEDYIEFVVANDANVALSHVLNYPNPFSTSTSFHFDHNRAGDDLEVMIQIYTVSGRLIKTLSSEYFGSGAHISDLEWDGRDEFGGKLGKGVYVYKVNVRSLSDGDKTHEIQKLVILN